MHYKLNLETKFSDSLNNSRS